MNPVLLKPGGDRRSHVVVHGRPAGDLSSSDFVEGRAHLARAAYDAFDDLSSRYEAVVVEGAGSPAEVNLRRGDYVNMGLARHAQIPTVVVGDIDRGGVFAAMYGTVALLDPADQALVAGFIVNKFRGDDSLLAPALEHLTELTGRPVYGVLPWRADLWLDSEDALDLAGRRATSGDRTLRVAVVRLPRISNFTDVDALGIEPDVDVVFASHPRALADADLVVLPGTRATVADLAWLREQGLDRAIVRHVGGGRLGAGNLRWVPDARPVHQRPRRRRGGRRHYGRRARTARRRHRLRPREGAAALERRGSRPARGRLRDPPRPHHPRRGRGVHRRRAPRLGLRDHVARQPRERLVPGGVPRLRGRSGRCRADRERDQLRSAARGPARPARRPGGDASRRGRAAGPDDARLRPRAGRCDFGLASGLVR